MKREVGTIAGLTAGVAVLFMIAWGGLLPPVAAQGEVTVSINAPAEVTPGGNFTATVNITQVANFDAASFDVSFNQTVLRLDTITDGNIGGVAVPVGIWNERQPGRYSIIVNIISGFTGATGSGYLAGLHFSVLGSAGQSSSISLSNGTLASASATEIPATWVGDVVSVIAGGAGNPVLPPAAANFSISDVLVTPLAVKPDEPVTISARVTNSGGSAGSYTAVLKVNGVREAAKEVVLGAGNIDTVSFTIVKSTTGTYVVDVNGKPGEFTVTALPTSPPPLPPTESPASPALGEPKEIQPPEVADEKEQLPPVTPETTTETLAAVTAPAPPPPSAPSQSVNWLLLGGIGGVVIVIGLFIFFQVSRRLS